MIGDRWGVTDAETRRNYPCDDVVPEPALRAWRGVTVHAPPANVWPWVRQIRLAPYSYDRVDNLGRRSPQTVQDIPETVAGQHFSTAAGRPFGRVLSVEPGEQLTGEIVGAVMSYVLVPTGDATRLLLKIVTRRTYGLGPLIATGDLVMARRQLLNWKALAEAQSSRRSSLA